MNVIPVLIVFALVLVSSVLLFLVVFSSSKKSKDKSKKQDLILSENEISRSTVSPEFKNAKIGYRAVVLCSPKRTFDQKRIDYKGQKDCRLFVSMYDGVYDCVWGCIGFGNCKKRCPRNAISIENSTAVVHKGCIGCGLCVESCPQKLIKLVPYDTKECVTCSYPEGNNEACHECHKTHPLNSSGEKDFKFWKSLYKLIYGKRSGK